MLSYINYLLNEFNENEQFKCDFKILKSINEIRFNYFNSKNEIVESDKIIFRPIKINNINDCYKWIIYFYDTCYYIKKQKYNNHEAFDDEIILFIVTIIKNVNEIELLFKKIYDQLLEFINTDFSDIDIDYIFNINKLINSISKCVNFSYINLINELYQIIIVKQNNTDFYEYLTLKTNDLNHKIDANIHNSKLWFCALIACIIYLILMIVFIFIYIIILSAILYFDTSLSFTK